MRPPVVGVAVVAIAASFAANVAASSGETKTVVIWPTLTPTGNGSSELALHKPVETERGVFRSAQELDATLRDAVQDLGFTVFVSDSGPSAGHTTDLDLLERAAHTSGGDSLGVGTWVLSPRIEVSGGNTVLRIVAVPPNGHELRVRIESVPSGSVHVRGLVMVRDLLSPATAEAANAERLRDRIDTDAKKGVVAPPRGEGRPVLAISSALFGAFTAFALQRSSGSDDPRVLYPLLAVGTGVGLGGALLAADEWNITAGSAWMFTGGALWGVASGISIGNGLHTQPFQDRYTWGVGGGLIGIGLATAALAKAPFDDGAAVLANSGAGVGLVLGGLANLAYVGSTTGTTPYTGFGYGAAIGYVGASAVAMFVPVSASRVLLMDLGFGAGALTGAAASSALIVKDPTPGRVQAWIGISAGAGLAGGVAAWALTGKIGAKGIFHRDSQPTAGVIGMSETRTGAVPIYGVGWQGTW